MLLKGTVIVIKLYVSTHLVGAILMSVKLSNVAHPVSVVAAGVSPQPTSDASIDMASSTATSSGSNVMAHAGEKNKNKQKKNENGVL